MKTICRHFILFSFLLGAALAQSQPATTATTDATTKAVPPANAGIDETDRLMQEYMARRAEWMALRKGALDQAAKAGDDNSRKGVLKKLEADEQPLLAKMGEAGKAYQDAKKQKNPDSKPRG